MNHKELIQRYRQQPQIEEICASLSLSSKVNLHLKGLVGSSKSLVAASVFESADLFHLYILPSREEASYFADDLATFQEPKQVLFFPSPFKKEGSYDRISNTAIMERTEVIDRLKRSKRPLHLVTYPEALCEKIASREDLQQNTFDLKVGDDLDVDFAIDFLVDSDFERTDFVYEPGTFSIRGGIIDIFSYAYELPYRIELYEDKIESIRAFDLDSQLSMRNMSSISIVPNLDENQNILLRVSLLEFIDKNTVLWSADLSYCLSLLKKIVASAQEVFNANPEIIPVAADEFLIEEKTFRKKLQEFRIVEMSAKSHFKAGKTYEFNITPQPPFNRNFDLLAESLSANSAKRFRNLIFSESAKQVERIYAIFQDLEKDVEFTPIYKSLSEGFIDSSTNIAVFTEHQIFSRYHRSRYNKSFSGKQALTLKELYELKPGDFVTHIDHGVGIFSGLEKIEVNGKMNEAVRLSYKDNDLLYVNIHSLHKISRFIGKEGKKPRLNKLGTNTWENLKNKTKKKVKDIARDLIKLYAERKARTGFAFQPDTYLQTELEASFIYEDTPDQGKSTEDVKRDMEAPHPMDRLVCGDVGFGKTEIAIRSAFKAATDGKQVAVLVPTTVLAAQHHKTFTERLKDFPVTIDYVSRFKSTQQQRNTLERLSEGKLDILIGTHRLLGKDIKFKDLGLLIIDEEQKFGVAAKEKLRALKVNVDTLTLTATPIPRTLQFSLMGSRDLSVINTPPPNRQPIETTVTLFDQELIRDAIEYEMDRGGQIFFVHNRIKDIHQMADLIRALVPQAKVGIGHGQMEGKELEEVMMNFVEGFYDVLVSTSIIESGLDISNANTIIINQAQNFGLSDLYQMRGRVGRSNQKAYAYLLTPPKVAMTSEARKRLAAIEEFSELGSGFHIAMKDLDIRGAGNLLGAEQSGFISEIGFDMYQKILDEAMHELRDEEFKDLFSGKDDRPLVYECQIDTDFELLIPDKYISNVNERVSIYNEMNQVKNEEALLTFQKHLTDRFGKIPKQTLELMDAIRLKWLAQNAGIGKINLKNQKLKASFAANADSDYYQSAPFGRILQYVQDHPQQCKFEQKGEQLTLRLHPVRSIHEALSVFHAFIAS
ncbi:MAG: transcription-repair coupling factor [Bacteroidia bacterium]